MFKKDWLHAQIYENDYRFNDQYIGGGEKGVILPFNEHENLHFDNEKDIHTNSKNHEESDYGMGFANDLV